MPETGGRPDRRRIEVALRVAFKAPDDGYDQKLGVELAADRPSDDPDAPWR